MKAACGSCGYTVDPDCEFCKGTGEVGPSGRNEDVKIPDVADLKAAEAKRYAQVRNRSGNAASVDKTKTRNRKKAKAAKKARKAQR